MFGLNKMLKLAALAGMLASRASAHSWVEEMQVISENGTYVGDYGYMRGYIDRTKTNQSQDYIIPKLSDRHGNGRTRNRINASDLLCPDAGRSSNYSAAYPKLKVTPGAYVAMKYLENGHVSAPWNQAGKPPGSGTVFVYGTTQPKKDEKIIDVLQWTTDGKSGDARGFQMAAQNFDDGRCHQKTGTTNISSSRIADFPDRYPDQPTSNAEQWCETNVKVPDSQATGTLTVYWVWQWPTTPNSTTLNTGYELGKDEYYTSCSDWDIIGSAGNEDFLAQNKIAHTLVQQDPQTLACSDFKSRPAYTTTPPIITEYVNATGNITTANFNPTVTHDDGYPNSSAIVSTMYGVSSISSAATVSNATYNSMPSASPPASCAAPAFTVPSAGEPVMTVTVTPPALTVTITAVASSAAQPTTLMSSESSMSERPTPPSPTASAASAPLVAEPAQSVDSPVPNAPASRIPSFATITTTASSPSSIAAASEPSVGADGLVEMNVIADSTGDVSEQAAQRYRHLRRHARYLGR